MRAGMRTSHRRTTWPPYSRPTRARWMGPRCVSSSTSTVCSMVRLSPDWPQCTVRTRRSAPCWPRSGCLARSARNRAPTACIPPCLVAFFRSVGPHFEAQIAGSAGLLLPLGVRRIRAYAPARTARFCYTRVTSADGAALEADLDVLDEHGTVLLAVRGLQLGIGA